jgi:class 3 adenylate cyclase/tetratricopeptide (TPR) repeat protein
MRTCPSCGFDNVEGANFCANCGARLASDERAAREERKIVSVVFADLVGSTARADQLDPEDVRAILAPYHDRLRHELERFGGTVEKFIGDAVVGVFGAPVAHEDDAERAVRAALAIQAAIAELNEADEGLDLEVRIGVHTGEALVSLAARPELGEAMVAGDVMNTAARLQAAAPAGGILAAEPTYRATSRAIEYEDTGEVEAKGKSAPLRTWRAVAPRARFGVDVFQAGRAPLVGRERELELLTTALARARAEREPQLVTLVGVPGIGKSRLVYELWRVVEDDPDLIVWRQGRSLPYGEGVAFWAVREIVKAQAGILESDDVPSAETKLAAAIRDLVEGPEGEWVERHLRPLVGLTGDAPAGHEQQAEVFAAWRRFFEGLAASNPTILVFEDLQWADDGALDFVDGLLERSAAVPLLVVCSTRPELLERRPGWGGGKRNALTVSLARLSERETAELLAALLERSVLPVEEQTALLKHAGGNPLYAEEYARMLADGDPGPAAVPESLQSVVAARIDALPDGEKRLLQQAAVLGKVFWTDALAALAGLDEWQLDELLHALERKEFVRREQRSAVAGARQYVFVHALVRDGAYGQMPRAVRADAHERVASWIEQLPPDRAVDRAEMLAHHLVQAVEYGRAGGLDVSPLLARTAHALRAAGDRAWALGAPHAALDHYERVRALDPESADDPWFLLRYGNALSVIHGSGHAELEQAARELTDVGPAGAAEAEMALGELFWQRGDQKHAFPHYDRAAQLVADAPVSTTKAAVLAQRARFLGLGGRYTEAVELAERVVEMTEELQDAEVLSDVLNTRAIVKSVLGDAGWRADLERSLSLAVERNSWRAARGYLNLGSTLVTAAAELHEADETYRQGLRFVERHGSALSERWYRANMAEAAYYLGDWDEALTLANDELGEPEPHYVQSQCRVVRAYVTLARGGVASALSDAQLAVEEARAVRDPQALMPAHSGRLFCLAAHGGGALGDALAELVAAADELESGASGPWIVDLALALDTARLTDELLELRHAFGPPSPWQEAALALGRGEHLAAAALLEEKGGATHGAYIRLSAARRFEERGSSSEAGEQLALAAAFFHGVGAGGVLREVDALRAAAG